LSLCGLVRCLTLSFSLASGFQWNIDLAFALWAVSLLSCLMGLYIQFMAVWTAKLDAHDSCLWLPDGERMLRNEGSLSRK
jgi:hypothetical protein